MKLKWLEGHQNIQMAKNGVTERIDLNHLFSFLVRVRATVRAPQWLSQNAHLDQSPHRLINPYLKFDSTEEGGDGKNCGKMAERRKECSWGLNMMWESETCFSLLGDERLKSLIDLSILNAPLRPSVQFSECACRFICAVSVYLRAKSVRMGKRWLITRCSFENRGTFILVCSFRRAAQGEMSTIRNKQSCHDNSWRWEQCQRESERGEKSDRCSKMEIEKDGKV